MAYFRRCVENQTNLRRVLFGHQYRVERELRLLDISELREDSPEISPLGFWITTWGPFLCDYIGRSFEGRGRLGRFRIASDDIAEIRRLALARHPGGGIIWKPPLSLHMCASRGFWRRDVLPTLDAAVGKVRYSVALRKIVVGKKKGRNAFNVGADTSTLFPLGGSRSAS